MKISLGKKLTARAGTATELLLTWEATDKPDFQGTVAGWFLDCPGQSPAWRHYGLSVISLRDIPGVKPARIDKPGATHEVMLVAYDPKANPDPLEPDSWLMLTPMNFAGQICLPSDEHAKSMLYSLAQGVIHGILWAEPPLSGQREPWARQLELCEEHAAGKHSN